MIKKIFISIFLVYSFVLLSSCKGYYNKKRTQVFTNYLLQTFQVTLTNEKTIIFVVTSYGCPACKTSLLNYLQNQTMNLKLIVVQDWEIQFPENIEILFDDNSIINRLNMNIAGTYLLFIKNKVIVDTFSVTPSTLPVLDEKISKFIASI